MALKWSTDATLCVPVHGYQVKHRLLLVQERDVVSLPLRRGATFRRAATPTRFQLLKRFDFEPSLMRSGVIAADQDGTAFLFVKGAPSMVKPLLRDKSLSQCCCCSHAKCDHASGHTCSRCCACCHAYEHASSTRTSRLWCHTEVKLVAYLYQIYNIKRPDICL